MPPDSAAAAAWLVELGSLVGGGLDEQQAERKVRQYAPHLAREFGVADFTPHSLGYVAARSRYFPGFGELCALLRQWCSDHRPYRRPLALAAPDRAPDAEPMTAEQLDRIRVTVREAVAFLTANESLPRAMPRLRSVSDAEMLAILQRRADAGDAQAADRVAHIRRRLAS